MIEVRLYFDVVSPYAWLALERAPSFAREFGVKWDPRPVVFAKLLEHHGLLGPAEVPARRRYTFHDAVRAARHLGLECVGPPAHPFRSLEAQRVVQAFRDGPHAVELARDLARAAWAEGRDLTDAEVRRSVVASHRLPAGDLDERIADPSVKAGLRANTDLALEDGAFGVPTFVLDGELFWGHDRMDALGRRIAHGPDPSAIAAAERALARPIGVRRRGV